MKKSILPILLFLSTSLCAMKKSSKELMNELIVQRINEYTSEANLILDKPIIETTVSSWQELLDKAKQLDKQYPDMVSIERNLNQRGILLRPGTVLDLAPIVIKILNTKSMKYVDERTFSRTVGSPYMKQLETYIEQTKKTHKK